MAIVASHMARAPPSKQYSFGFKRVESLVALFSMVSLAVMSIALGVEAVRRICMQIQDPDNKDMNSVDGKTMAMISLIGVVVNIILALVLGEHGHVHMPGVDHHSHEHHSHTNCHSHNEGESFHHLLKSGIIDVMTSDILTIFNVTSSRTSGYCVGHTPT